MTSNKENNRETDTTTFYRLLKADVPPAVYRTKSVVKRFKEICKEVTIKKSTATGRERRVTFTYSQQVGFIKAFINPAMRSEQVLGISSDKNADKAILPKLNEEFEEKAAALKEILVEKLLVLTNDKVSQGVKDYLGTEVIAKGAKFTKRDLESLDYTIIQLSKWTSDAHKNDMIRDLIMNYLKKYKELDAELKRKKFALTIGDELPVISSRTRWQ
jgi:DNA-binding Lrp family transcriptional regulator